MKTPDYKKKKIQSLVSEIEEIVLSEMKRQWNILWENESGQNKIDNILSQKKVDHFAGDGKNYAYLDNHPFPNQSTAREFMSKIDFDSGYSLNRLDEFLINNYAENIVDWWKENNLL